MAGTRRETHFLKLVHPGGFVELHANPIMASQVMNKNPRHYVTRPDFFQFPWIVVSPESILTPGNVFYIVPCQTIRHVLKSTNHTLPSHSHESHLSHFLSNQSSLHQHYPHTQSNISNSNKLRCFPKQSSLPTSTSGVKPRQGHKHSKGLGGKKVQSLSFVRERPLYYSSEYTSRSRDSGKVKVRSQQTPKLKPCLKKDNTHSARSRRNLKVTFECNDVNVNIANFTTKTYHDS